MPKYKILKDFDFVPIANVVIALKAGEIRTDLIRACVAKGKALGALKLVAKKDKKDG